MLSRRIAARHGLAVALVTVVAIGVGGVAPVASFTIGGHTTRAVAPAVASTPLAADTVTSERGDTTTHTVGLRNKTRMVGVTWPKSEAPSAATTVRVREKDADGTWGAWQTLAMEDSAPEAGTAEGKQAKSGTAPLWLGDDGADKVQVSITAPAAASKAVKTRTHQRASLTEVTPGTAAQSDAAVTAQPVAQASAAVAKPAIVTRAQWGARAPSCSVSSAAKIKAVVIHHTVNANGYTAAQVPAIIRSDQAYHMSGEGWCDLGYNFLVDSFGRIYEGRSGSLTKAVIAAHTLGFNTGTMGVALIGNFQPGVAGIPATKPTQAMLTATEKLIAWRTASAGLNPTGKVALASSMTSGSIKYAAGRSVSLPTILGHRDLNYTACPGDYLYSDLAAIRSGVAKLEKGSTSSSGSTSSGSTTTTSAASAAATRAAGEQAISALYASKKSVLGAATGTLACGLTGGGCRQRYAKGGIYWTKSTGAHSVYGTINTTYTKVGTISSKLGYPTGERKDVRTGTRRLTQTFQHGTVTWTKATKAHTVYGAMNTAWVKSGGISSKLGMPKAERKDTGKGTARIVKQRCQKGTIVWRGSTKKTKLYFD